jgi:ABC-type nitrate/sulfonate/bicarbonate transport system substrate-binding protein
MSKTGLTVERRGDYRGVDMVSDAFDMVLCNARLLGEARRRRARSHLLAALLVLAVATFASPALAGERLTVLVPKDNNLQYMSFWVAKAGGYFEREGIDIELVVPSAPQQTESMFEGGQTEAAVLAPPMYLRFIGAKVPLLLVANLLRNDPIDLVVRRSILEQRKLTPTMPLKERLEGLRGLRLGVAPHPPTRLRMLFASEGMDVDKDLKLVILHGREQNAAFTDGEVDALYAHTPFLEKAIVHDDAVVLVEQTRGEFAGLANRQIHCLVLRRSVAQARPALVLAAVRAIGAAEQSIHASQKDTVELLARTFPTRERRELETIVRLYEPAIPDAPDVHVADIAPALALFPDGQPKPDLSAIDLAPYVATGVVAEARDAKARDADSSARARWIVAAVSVFVVVGSALAILSARRKRDER